MTKKWTYNLETFYNEDDVSYYLLGAFMTDGCVQPSANKNSPRISITSKDANWLELINGFICPDKPVKNRTPRNCHEATYNSNELVKWFVSKGCGPRKSLTLEFPDVPEQYLPDFLRGCYDGDGTLSFGKIWRKDRECFEMKRQCGYFTSSPKFKDSLIALINSFGMNTHLKVRNNERMIGDRFIAKINDNYSIGLTNGEDIYTFLSKLYYPNHRLSMPRKAAIAAALIADWEREFFCQECNIAIYPDKNSRSQKYCSVCQLAVIKAQQLKSGAKHYLKKKLIRKESQLPKP